MLVREYMKLLWRQLKYLIGTSYIYTYLDVELVRLLVSNDSPGSRRGWKWKLWNDNLWHPTLVRSVVFIWSAQNLNNGPHLGKVLMHELMLMYPWRRTLPGRLLPLLIKMIFFIQIILWYSNANAHSFSKSFHIVSSNRLSDHRHFRNRYNCQNNLLN